MQCWIEARKVTA